MSSEYPMPFHHPGFALTRWMHKYRRFVFGLICPFPMLATEVSVAQDNELLQEIVQEQREIAGVVGMAAVVLQDGELLAAAAAGEREIRSDDPIRPDHKFHLGSITKSITATVIAHLVEEGELQWDSTVGEIFGDDVHAQWNAVTLAQLLSHSSGARRNADCFDPTQSFNDDFREIQRVREACVRKFLQEPPENPPGSIFVYSNAGFVVAATMAEVASSASWEALTTNIVFEPLGLRSAGFGPPTEVDQPRGHRKQFFLFKAPVEPTEDNPPSMGPAGTVHMSLIDLARFGYEHVLGERGQSSLLSQGTFQILHSPVIEDVALGWGVQNDARGIADRFLWHNGSNGYWYALLVIIPERHAVIAVATNDDTNEEEVPEIFWRIVAESLPLLD